MAKGTKSDQRGGVSRSSVSPSKSAGKVKDRPKAASTVATTTISVSRNKVAQTSSRGISRVAKSSTPAKSSIASSSSHPHSGWWSDGGTHHDPVWTAADYANPGAKKNRPKPRKPSPVQSPAVQVVRASGLTIEAPKAASLNTRPERSADKPREKMVCKARPESNRPRRGGGGGGKRFIPWC